MTRIRQRTGGDCGVAALAILVAYQAARRLAPQMHGLDGAYNREVIAFAKDLRPIHLRSVRRFDLDQDEGILSVRWHDPDRRRLNPGGHFVAVLGAVIHDPANGSARPWRDYVIQEEAQLCTLLKVTS